MIKQLFASALLGVAVAACGGGGAGGAGGYGGPTGMPGGVNNLPLATTSLNGGAGFVYGSQGTVYVFDADLCTPNGSACTGACAGTWPPVLFVGSGSIPANWNTFQRADGSTQVAYKTRALYTYAGDSAAGQFNGDGLNQFGGVWHIARP